MIVTWAQLGFHEKPIGLLDVDDYLAPLVTMLSHAAAEGFVRPGDRQRLHVAHDAAALVEWILATAPPDRR